MQESSSAQPVPKLSSIRLMQISRATRSGRQCRSDEECRPLRGRSLTDIYSCEEVSLAYLRHPQPPRAAYALQPGGRTHYHYRLWLDLTD
jgi:hypothetical protein